MSPTIDAPVIMVIDDEPDNLNVMEAVLGKAGYRVLAFPRGEQGLEAARAHPPDLVLLDVRMPSMLGYDVCREMKSSEALADVPVIFISALEDADDKVRAFDSGGVDYLTKPFCPAEILKRIEVQLRVRALQKELERHNRELEQEVVARSRELAEAHRQLKIWNEAKTGWLNLASHEFRTPMTGILGVADMMAQEIPPDSPTASLVEVYHEARERMVNLIDDASLLTSIQIGVASLSWVSVPVASNLPYVLEQSERRVAPSTVAMLHRPESDLCILGDGLLLRKALSCLIWTAACCMPPGGTIGLAFGTSGDRVLIDARMYGERLPADVVATLFEVCGQRRMYRPGGDLGLAPALCRQISQLMGGDARVCDASDGGMAIRMELRRAVSP